VDPQLAVLKITSDIITVADVALTSKNASGARHMASHGITLIAAVFLT
jgi:hypothetical protein